MLENEPDTNLPSPQGDATPAVTPPPRRRRAASRPAGPPAPAPDTPPVEQAPAVEKLDTPPVPAPAEAPAQIETPAPVAQQPETVAVETASQAEVPAVEVQADPPVRAAKRPARRTSAKKAAAEAAEAAAETPVGETADSGPVEAPPKRPARKRASKKAAPAEVAAEAPAPDTAPTDTAPADTSPTDTAPTDTAPADTSPTDTAPTDTAPADTVPAAAEADRAQLVSAPSDPEASEHPAGWLTPSSDSEPVVATETVPEPALADPPPVETAGGETASDQPVVEGSPDEALADDEAPLDESGLPDQESSEPTTGNEPEARDFGWLADPFAPPTAGRHDTAAATPTSGAPGDADSAGDADSLVGADSAGDVDAPEPEQDADQDDEEAGEGGNRRRRRRRGGRRRRRGGDDDASDTDDEDSSSEPVAPTAPADAEEPTEDSGDEGDGEDSEGQRRRRRRRRRRGEETASLPDDPAEVVVRVREPRARGNTKSASSEVTGIQGSTRMEAKRQRRREGRDAGRRRVPILSEAEFLARRESVSRKMIIRQNDELAQIAVLEDGILVEHYVDRDSAASLIGNVYLGRVQNVLPSMEAAFIDIGRGRNAVLYAGEVDWDSFGAEGQNRKVEKVLKSGQMMLVQVSKDPIGAKGARLTNHVSIPGRYVVYAPGGHLSGISRKLPDVERRRLKDILADLVGESASVIVRTAAEGASEEELVRDVNRLKAQWEDIESKVKGGNSPQLLYGEPDLTVRIVRDLFTEDFSELIIQGNGSMNDAYDSIMGYVTHVAPHLQERITRWEPDGDSDDLFAEYRLDEQIAKALERKVFLPSGGSLVIDKTEAMTVIDVNTGKFTGTGGNLEATVTSNNLEAAEEIVRQLRLRDVGGIIVIDFIDMVLPTNRELLLRRLVECLGRDRTRHQVAEVTSLGLVQMTRKKIGTGLLEAFGTECPHCLGRGYLVHEAPVDSQQQADGGTRDQKPRDFRSRGGGSGGNGSGGNGSGGSGSGGSASGDNGSGDKHGANGDQGGRGRRGRRGGRNAAAGADDAGGDQDGGAESGGEASEAPAAGVETASSS